VKVVKEGKEGMGASSMWVEKGRIWKTEEVRVGGGGEMMEWRENCIKDNTNSSLLI
jgi:hypothetical protein